MTLLPAAGRLEADRDALREQSLGLKGRAALAMISRTASMSRLRLPDPRHTSSFEFCENGAKAVAAELTDAASRVELFATHTVSELESRATTGSRARPAHGAAAV